MRRWPWRQALLTTARAWQQKLQDRWQLWVLTLILLFAILIPGVEFRPLLPPPAEKPLPPGRQGDEVNLLARLVAAEAKDEPYIGKVAVAAVVLNRTRHPDFPPNIPGVIFEPWAFESVMNGSFWQVTVEEPDYRASLDALSDWDPSGGALYFFNPATSTSPWIWTRPQITIIGRHIFAL